MQIYLIFYTKLPFPMENDLFSSQKYGSRPFVISADGKHKVYVNNILD